MSWTITKEVTSDATYQPILQEACAFYGITEPIALFEGTQTGNISEEATAFDGFICISNELREHHAPYGYIRGLLFHEIAHIRHHDRALERILDAVSPTKKTLALFTLGQRFVERRNDTIAFYATNCVHCMFDFAQCSTTLSRTALTISMGYLSAPDIQQLLNQFMSAHSTCAHHASIHEHTSSETTDALSILTAISTLASQPKPRGISTKVWRECCASIQLSCGRLIQFNESDPSAIELGVLIEELPDIISQQIRVIDISHTSMLTVPQTLLDQITNINVLYVNARQYRGLKPLGENSDLQIEIKKD
jgi:hypothetical protein